MHEQIKLWHVPRLHNLMVLHATYLQHTFPRHTHEDFALGVIEHGALGFEYRGARLVAPPGSINLANPDTAHTGYAAATTGWTYRMVYVPPRVLEQVATDIAGRARPLPFFQAGVLHDVALARRIQHFHCALEQPERTPLEHETLLLAMLSHLISRYADDRVPARRINYEPQYVRRIRDYIEAKYADDITLDTLVQLIYLSPYHLIRVFHQATGMPPHAYLLDVRIKHAKQLLQAGQSIADVAQMTGFVDQSHFHKQFKRVMGMTPGQYRNFLQDTGR